MYAVRNFTRHFHLNNVVIYKLVMCPDPSFSRSCIFQHLIIFQVLQMQHPWQQVWCLLHCSCRILLTVINSQLERLWRSIIGSITWQMLITRHSRRCAPAVWNSANVAPIFKKGSRTDPGNYRPVSLTSVPSKIMESIIRDDTLSFLESSNKLNSYQHGFTRKRSCLTNLLESLETWTQALD